MPLKRCTSNGKSGWQYGDSGHCYTGPGAKKKAIRQGVAESYNSGEKFHSNGELTTADVGEIYGDLDFSDETFAELAKEEYTEGEIRWLLGLRRLSAKTKTYEVKYEKDGRTITTSVDAKSTSDARKYVKNEHPDATIVDVYEI